MPPSGSIYWLKVSLSFAMFLWSHIYKLSQPFCSDSQDTEAKQTLAQSLEDTHSALQYATVTKVPLAQHCLQDTLEEENTDISAGLVLCPRFVPGPAYPRMTTQKLLSSDLDGGTLACARTSWGRSRQGSWRRIKRDSLLENSSPGEEPQQFSEDQLVRTSQPCHTDSLRSAPSPWSLT